MIKLTTIKQKVRKHINKRNRLRKTKNSWSWFAKLYSMGERQFFLFNK